MNFVYTLRLLNAVLAGLVCGLCFLRVGWDKANQARNARVAGLGILSVAIAWGSFARIHDVFKPWLPLVTVGLVLCLYGMRRHAPGERPR